MKEFVITLIKNSMFRNSTVKSQKYNYFNSNENGVLHKEKVTREWVNEVLTQYAQKN